MFLIFFYRHTLLSLLSPRRNEYSVKSWQLVRALVTWHISYISVLHVESQSLHVHVEFMLWILYFQKKVNYKPSLVQRNWKKYEFWWDVCTMYERNRKVKSVKRWAFACLPSEEKWDKTQFNKEHVYCIVKGHHSCTKCYSFLYSQISRKFATIAFCRKAFSVRINSTGDEENK